MGSYCGTCGITGLPIEQYDDLVCIVLKKVGIGEEGIWKSYIDSRYNPILFPVYGKYNGVGTIEGGTIQNKGFVNKIIEGRIGVKESFKEVVKRSVDADKDRIILKNVDELLERDINIRDVVYCNGLNTYKVDVIYYHRGLYERIITKLGNREDNGIKIRELVEKAVKEDIDRMVELAQIDIECKGKEDIDKILEVWRKKDKIELEIGRVNIGDSYNLNSLELIEQLGLYKAENKKLREEYEKEVTRFYIFQLALRLLRKGYGVLSGAGDSHVEYLLHLEVCEWIKEFVEKKREDYINEIYGDREDIDYEEYEKERERKITKVNGESRKNENGDKRRIEETDGVHGDLVEAEDEMKYFGVGDIFMEIMRMKQIAGIKD